MAGQDHYLDTLATGMAKDTISRGRAIKLAGAALLGSALALVSAQEADAVTGQQRRRCRRRYGGQGILCSGRGRVVCCNDATTTAKRCSAGKCGGVAPSPPPP
jgi:hypothetical protein